MLNNKLKNKQAGLLFYGLTPPKIDTNEEKLRGIAQRQIERIENLPIDALILYDIQDESSRTDAERPFPFMRTMLPQDYSNNYLSALKIPRIIYQSVGKYTPDEFRSFVTNKQNNVKFSVFVGAPSTEQKTNLSLSEAYKIKQSTNSEILVGGVAIPERHVTKGDEHLRVIRKIENGCSYFVTQCVYSVNNSKDFISDVYYYSKEHNLELVPIIFTLTPCGSLKTLEFMKWLGIDIPKWLYNELIHSENILEKSIENCKLIAAELIEFCKSKNIPIGFNIESVAIRKEEIEASIQLVKDIHQMLHHK